MSVFLGQLRIGDTMRPDDQPLLTVRYASRFAPAVFELVFEFTQGQPDAMLHIASLHDGEPAMSRSSPAK